MTKTGKPNEWENCPRMSSAAVFGRFVAFKTPYHNGKLDRPQNGESFTVFDVFRLSRERGMTIGLWIDLTDTSRYYNGADVERHSCYYVKLNCPGGKMANLKTLNPLTKSFINVCNSFFDENPDQLVGVHCTHGFNRTGYFIVSYMVEVFGWNVLAAVNEFARLRPPGIYRSNILKEMSKKYKIALQVPPPPVWTKSNWGSQWHVVNKQNRNRDHCRNVNAEKNVVNFSGKLFAQSSSNISEILLGPDWKQNGKQFMCDTNTDKEGVKCNSNSEI